MKKHWRWQTIKIAICAFTAGLLIAGRGAAVIAIEIENGAQSKGLEGQGDEAVATKHYALARRIYASCLVSDSENVQVMLKLARVDEKMGDLDKAISHGRLACQLEPKNVQAHLQLGQFLEDNRDDKAAELQYERAMDLKPSAVQSRLAQSRAVSLLIKLDSLPQADKLSKRWVHAHSKIGDCHFNRGLVLAQSVKAENWQEAVNEFEKSLRLNPAFNGAHYQLALVLLKLGEKQAAKEQLEDFIKGGANGDELHLAKEQLQHL